MTNFCAPAFVLLAGTAAYLYGQKLGGRSARGQLARWLVTRGVWLVFLELTVLRFAWTFNFHYTQTAMAGVIWCIGWCMALVAGLIYLPMPAILVLGVAIVGGHNVVDAYRGQMGPVLEKVTWAWVWQVLYFGGVVERGGLLYLVWALVLIPLYFLCRWYGDVKGRSRNPLLSYL